MEFARVVGSRRSIRWFKPWQPVERASVQRILEAARLTGSPGNLQPWRAVVVWVADLPAEDREALLRADNHQRAHEQAPVWIYWFADLSLITPSAFLEQIALGVEQHVLAREAGWSVDAARAAFEDGTPVPAGMAPLHTSFRNLPPWILALLACQETNAACAVACLAAVDEGLGTCLHIAAAPERQADLRRVLGVPQHFIPVWVQLLGHPAEDPAAGGQRPRRAFDELFSVGRWGTGFARDESVVAELRGRGLLQTEGPLPGRAAEVAALARMFELTVDEPDR